MKGWMKGWIDGWRDGLLDRSFGLLCLIGIALLSRSFMIICFINLFLLYLGLSPFISGLPNSLASSGCLPGNCIIQYLQLQAKRIPD